MSREEDDAIEKIMSNRDAFREGKNAYGEGVDFDFSGAQQWQLGWIEGAREAQPFAAMVRKRARIREGLTSAFAAIRALGQARLRGRPDFRLSQQADEALIAINTALAHIPSERDGTPQSGGESSE